MTPHGSEGARRGIVGFAALAMAVGACGGAETTRSPEAPRLQGCATSGTYQYTSVPGVETDLTSVDVYTPGEADDGCVNRPLVVWVHGGGWTEGDKSEYMSDKVRLLVAQGASSVDIRKTAREEGMRSLRESAFEKVMRGRTTVTELVRVTGK